MKIHLGVVLGDVLGLSVIVGLICLGLKLSPLVDGWLMAVAR